MKNLLLILLLLPITLFSQTINLKNDNHYVTINTLDSNQLNQNFNPNLVNVTSWGDEYTHTIVIDTINNQINITRVELLSGDEYSNEYIILDLVSTEYGKIYQLGGFDGSYSFLYFNGVTVVFGVEIDYGIYRGILGYVN